MKQINITYGHINTIPHIDLAEAHENSTEPKEVKKMVILFMRNLNKTFQPTDIIILLNYINIKEYTTIYKPLLSVLFLPCLFAYQMCKFDGKTLTVKTPSYACNNR